MNPGYALYNPSASEFLTCSFRDAEEALAWVQKENLHNMELVKVDSPRMEQLHHEIDLAHRRI